MSGHSKWHRIKRAKAATDAKRGAEFTKLAQNIKAAARTGNDPSKNSALAAAIERAKAANMPQTNIDRLLAGSDKPLEIVTYEGFGPAGVSLLIQAETDNTNRTVSEIRTTLKKHQGSLGGPGSVAWKFKAALLITSPAPSPQQHDDVELALIDAGAEDIESVDDQLFITAPPATQDTLVSALKTQQLDPTTIDHVHLAKQSQSLADADQEKLTPLIDELTEHPDITAVYTDATEK